MSGVTGINCDHCKEGYWNLGSGKGCERKFFLIKRKKGCF